MVWWYTALAVLLLLGTLWYPLAALRWDESPHALKPLGRSMQNLEAWVSSENGSNAHGCGTSASAACQTLPYAYAQVATGVSNETAGIILHVMGGTYWFGQEGEPENTLEASPAAPLMLQGEKGDVLFCVAAVTAFKITGGETLSLANARIATTADSSACPYALIIGGSLSLSNVTFADIRRPVALSAELALVLVGRGMSLFVTATLTLSDVTLRNVEASHFINGLVGQVNVDQLAITQCSLSGFFLCPTDYSPPYFSVRLISSSITASSVDVFFSAAQSPHNAVFNEATVEVSGLFVKSSQLHALCVFSANSILIEDVLVANSSVSASLVAADRFVSIGLSTWDISDSVVGASVFSLYPRPNFQGAIIEHFLVTSTQPGDLGVAAFIVIKAGSAAFPVTSQFRVTLQDSAFADMGPFSVLSLEITTDGRLASQLIVFNCTIAYSPLAASGGLPAIDFQIAPTGYLRSPAYISTVDSFSCSHCSGPCLSARQYGGEMVLRNIRISDCQLAAAAATASNASSPANPLTGAIMVGSPFFSNLTTGAFSFSNVTVDTTANFAAPIVISTSVSIPTLSIDASVFTSNTFKASGGVLLDLSNTFSGITVDLSGCRFAQNTPSSNSSFPILANPSVVCLLSGPGDPLSTVKLDGTNSFSSPHPFADFQGASCMFYCDKQYDEDLCHLTSTASHSGLTWWQWALIGIGIVCVICLISAIVCLYCTKKRSGYQRIN